MPIVLLAQTLTDGFGKPLNDLWSLAPTNLAAALQTLAPQLKRVAAGLFSASTEVGLGVLQVFVSILIAGFLLANSGQGAKLSRKLAIHLFSNRAAEFEALTVTTVRCATTGILGVALIQSLFAGVGFVVVGLPGSEPVGPCCSSLPLCFRLEA